MTVARNSERDAALLGTAVRPIRILVAVVLGAGIACAIIVVATLRLGRVEDDAIPLVQGIELAMNIAILVGLGLLALTRTELHWKRRRALASLHALRSLAHVIDMHQLTKDPSEERLARAPTQSSPKRDLTPSQLVRYLDAPPRASADQRDFGARHCRLLPMT